MRELKMKTKPMSDVSWDYIDELEEGCYDNILVTERKTAGEVAKLAERRAEEKHLKQKREEDFKMKQIIDSIT